MRLHGMIGLKLSVWSLESELLDAYVDYYDITISVLRSGI